MKASRRGIFALVDDTPRESVLLVSSCLIVVLACVSTFVSTPAGTDELPDTSIMADTLVFEALQLEPEQEPSTERDSCTSPRTNAAFDAGEWFHFSVQYGFVKAGDALMQVEGIEDVNGHQCYHLVSKAESSGFFSLFFKVRDKIDSFLDKNHLVSRRFSKKIHEGKHRKNSSVEFNHDRGVASYSDGTEVELIPCAQDILSAFYYVRILRLNVGERVSVPCHTDKKNYPLEVIVHRRETVKTPAGRFDCLVIEPVLKSEGIFSQKGRLTIWLTDDERRIPVIMKSKVAVGSISAILTDMHLVTAGGQHAQVPGKEASQAARESSGSKPQTADRAQGNTDIQEEE